LFDLLERRCPLRRGITVRFSNRGGYVGSDIWRDLDRLDDVTEKRRQLLFANVDIGMSLIK
jgi:hypothetical protein